MTHPAGRVSFSPEPDEPHYVDTVATFTCGDGYVLLPVGGGGSTRRCEIGGWNGTNPTCSKLLMTSYSEFEAKLPKNTLIIIQTGHNPWKKARIELTV